MERMVLSVSSVICVECSVALKKFIGSIKGVRAVVVVNGREVDRIVLSIVDESK